MNIYISGISGTGMGPLALMAKSAGLTVFGSDLAEGPVASELRAANIDFEIGPQDGNFLRKIHEKSKIDWFVHTSALPEDHPELALAKDLNLKVSKRDEFISYLVEKLNLKMVAVAGTHGKTTTTSMLIWATRELKIPASYLVGTTLPFAPAGKYTKGDKFFIYEADEYDRNFLHFHPWLSIITSVTYDHPDIYPTLEDYRAAFDQFRAQSENVIEGGETDPRLNISGALRREDATSALKALACIIRDIAPSSMAHCAGYGRAIAAEPRDDGREDRGDREEEGDTRIINVLNAFPGAGRRFEKIAPGVYSDYAHHPEEISATLEMANEEAEKLGLEGVVALYQPHQNTRQHKVRIGYKTAFSGVKKLFWLPTYLTREDETLPVLTPEDFISDLYLTPAKSPASPSPNGPITPPSPNDPVNPPSPLDNLPTAEPADLNDALASRLKSAYEQGYLILLLTAGPADAWFRSLWGKPTR